MVSGLCFFGVWGFRPGLGFGGFGDGFIVLGSRTVPGSSGVSGIPIIGFDVFFFFFWGGVV